MQGSSPPVVDQQLELDEVPFHRTGIVGPPSPAEHPAADVKMPNGDPGHDRRQNEDTPENGVEE